jgi:hypothetical protein
MLGTVLASLGELVPARAHLEQGLALYDPQQHPPLPSGYPSFATYSATVCLSSVAGILIALGYPDQALQRSREALILAQERRHPYGLAFVLLSAAGLHMARQEWQSVQEQAEAVINLPQKWPSVTRSVAILVQRGADAPKSRQAKTSQGKSKQV